MLLVFKSDASVQRKVIANKLFNLSKIIQPDCSVVYGRAYMYICGGHLTALDTSNQIFSHAKLGDVNYENKEDCDWIIKATQGKNVHLSFLKFELEVEQDCGYDFIEGCFLTET